MRHLCEHISLTHLTTSTKYTCGLYTGINVLLDFLHIIWACGLSTSAAYSRDFTVLFCIMWPNCVDFVIWGIILLGYLECWVYAISYRCIFYLFHVFKWLTDEVAHLYWRKVVENYHTLWVKKTRHPTDVDNFAKNLLISKILSLIDSEQNFLQNKYCIASVSYTHLTLPTIYSV